MFKLCNPDMAPMHSVHTYDLCNPDMAPMHSVHTYDLCNPDMAPMHSVHTFKSSLTLNHNHKSSLTLSHNHKSSLTLNHDHKSSLTLNYAALQQEIPCNNVDDSSSVTLRLKQLSLYCDLTRLWLAESGILVYYATSDSPMFSLCSPVMLYYNPRPPTEGIRDPTDGKPDPPPMESQSTPPPAKL